MVFINRKEDTRKERVICCTHQKEKKTAERVHIHICIYSCIHLSNIRYEER